MWWVYYNNDKMPPTDIYMDSDVTQLDINHYSAAMYFIKKADPDTQVPLKLCYGANTLTGVPDWREERSVYGETPIFLWCQRTKFLREPPEYLKYPGWKKEKHTF